MLNKKRENVSFIFLLNSKRYIIISLSFSLLCLTIIFSVNLIDNMISINKLLTKNQNINKLFN